MDMSVWYSSLSTFLNFWKADKSKIRAPAGSKNVFQPDPHMSTIYTKEILQKEALAPALKL